MNGIRALLTRKPPVLIQQGGTPQEDVSREAPKKSAILAKADITTEVEEALQTLHSWKFTEAEGYAAEPWIE